ncbi:MAG: type IV toxin-antitoxin system AbiEi family antitoxin domain-containing protein [Caldilinea sp.]
MTQNINQLGAQEASLLAQLSADGHTIFTTAQAQTLLGDDAYTANTLSRLVKKGWLQRLQRGLYLIIPLEAGPERLWSESGLVIAGRLVQPSAVAYWSALHYWGMTEQVPQVVFVQTTQRKAALQVLGMHFRFVTLPERRFFGVVQRTVDGKAFAVTDREKTLLDAAARPDLCGGVTQLAQALSSNHPEVNWSRLDDYLQRWGAGVVVKRLGYLIETLHLPVPDRVSRLEQWQGWISQGISMLEPGADTGSVTAPRWNLRVNVAVEAMYDHRS